MGNSATIKGVGLLNSGHYTSKFWQYKSEDWTLDKLRDQAINRAKLYASELKIDSLSNLANTAFYIAGGNNDPVVPIHNQEA